MSYLVLFFGDISLYVLVSVLGQSLFSYVVRLHLLLYSVCSAFLSLVDKIFRFVSCFLLQVPRNYSPSAHPMEEAREYKRALNAVKLEKVFAKPFLASLDGHRDGVSRSEVVKYRIEFFH